VAARSYFWYSRAKKMLNFLAISAALLPGLRPLPQQSRATLVPAMQMPDVSAQMPFAQP